MFRAARARAWYKSRPSRIENGLQALCGLRFAQLLQRAGFELTNALARQAMQPVDIFRNGREAIGIQSLRCRAIPSVKPEKPQNTQVIFANTLVRIFNKPHSPCAQSPLDEQPTVGSSMQRKQSLLSVHSAKSSRQKPWKLPSVPPQGSSAVFAWVPVETLVKLIKRPTPEMLAVAAGGQVVDTPPKSGLIASTMQGAPLLGPPSQVSESPSARLGDRTPQRGQGVRVPFRKRLGLG